MVVLEAEPLLSAHSSGRSAAMCIDNYGSATTRALTRASRAALERGDLLTRRGFLHLADVDHLDEVARFVEDGRREGVVTELLDGAQARALFPPLREASAVAAAYEPGAADVDVARLHEHYVSALRRAGGEVRVGARVTWAERAQDTWHLGLDGGSRLLADVLVNAAGAWADVLATLAGMQSLGLQPLRRTAFVASRAADRAVDRAWPLVHDAGERWYVRPEGDGVLGSLADEQPNPPEDVRPRELDIALALDRINEATTLDLRHVRSSWAGLRTFAPDRDMVLGPDPKERSFVWYAGLGGFGIQTSPAAAELVAALAVGEPPGDHLAAIDVSGLSAGRPTFTDIEGSTNVPGGPQCPP